MQQNNENYEKAYQDCERDIKEIENEIKNNEEEIKKREEANLALNTRKQDSIELRQVLSRFVSPSVTKIGSQFDESSIEQSTNIQSEIPESVFTVETSKGLIEISSNAFKDLDITDAISKFLRIVNQPQKTSQIVTALLKGGYETESAFFSENVRSALRNADKSSKSAIVWKNKLWQLADSEAEPPNFLKPIETKKSGKRGFGVPKWGRSIADVSEEILGNERNGLHLDEIRQRLNSKGLHPTVGSLDVALRQDKKKRFRLVSRRTYGLVEK